MISAGKRPSAAGSPEPTSHGRSSFVWNGEDEARGRHVWCNCPETFRKNERHFFSSLNYVHHNPVLHGYADRWQDWPWSSATQFIERVGRKHAAALWRNYSIVTYGADWDRDPESTA